MLENWNNVLFTFTIFGSKPIDITTWTIFGFIGQQLFTARVLIQWIASEKAKKSVAPPAFWWTSLIANLMLLIYSLNQSKKVTAYAMSFVFLYTINIVPYVRNIILTYKVKGKKINLITFIVSFIVVLLSIIELRKMETAFQLNLWFLVGTFVGFLYGSRFIWQWLYAEYKKESILPLWFWWLSIISSLFTLIYAIYIWDPNFMIGFTFNTIPMIRNVMIIKKHQTIQSENKAI